MRAKFCKRDSFGEKTVLFSLFPRTAIGSFPVVGRSQEGDAAKMLRVWLVNYGKIWYDMNTNNKGKKVSYEKNELADDGIGNLCGLCRL